jgi:hypothetical protein
VEIWEGEIGTALNADSHQPSKQIKAEAVKDIQPEKDVHHEEITGKQKKLARLEAEALNFQNMGKKKPLSAYGRGKRL